MILAYGLPILTQHTKVRKNIDYIRTRFTFLFQMFFLLVSYLLSELRYNGEVRKFNEAIEKLRQKYINLFRKILFQIFYEMKDFYSIEIFYWIDQFVRKRLLSSLKGCVYASHNIKT